jgi:carbamoyltransferase
LKWRHRLSFCTDKLSEFEKLTGVGAVMNTSFNLKGDAIVESPRDAVQTFFTSGLDWLVMGDFVVGKLSTS